MKTLIAMSGGVDSSVAAKLMIDRGSECVGCTMILKSDECIQNDASCCSTKDINDAKSVCNESGIDHFVCDFSTDFRKKVIDPFICCYENGITPNPCVNCNKHFKFNRLIAEMNRHGCDHIVTGHYARVEEKDGNFYLKKAIDKQKDQSYVLYFLNQDQLRHIFFPLGELTKERVRQVAFDNGFINANKSDSQDICFVPNGKYTDVIQKMTGKNYSKGVFLDTKGNVIGQHKGIIYYTIGQHKKLGMSFPEPMYVCAIDAANNSIILGKEEDLYRREVEVKSFNWINERPLKDGFKCNAKIRYRQSEQPATIIYTGVDSIKIIFDQAQRAVTPGQSAVLYDDDIVLGGGIIS